MLFNDSFNFKFQTNQYLSHSCFQCNQSYNHSDSFPGGWHMWLRSYMDYWSTRLYLFEK